MIVFIGNDINYLNEIIKEIKDKSHLDFSDKRFIVLKSKSKDIKILNIDNEELFCIEERGRGLLPLSKAEREKEEEYANMARDMVNKSEYVFLARN